MKRVYSLEEFGVKKHKTILSNGLKVIFIEKPFAPIYAEIEMGAGSLFNPLDNGLAHFTEHILMNGSKNTSKEEFLRLMESIGGFKNAFTSKYRISVDAEIAEASHLPYMKKYFSEALESIYITKESLEKEKEIIFSELQRARSNPSYDQGFKLMNFLTQGGPWSYSNLGIAEYMNNIKMQDVEGFFSKYCVAENSTLIVAGGCTLSDIENTFSDIRLLHGEKSVLPKSPDMISPAQRFFLYHDQPQTDVMILFNGPVARSRDIHILNFAMSFSHVGLGSLFYRNIRMTKGLSYSVKSSYFVFNSVSYFGTEIGVPTQKVDEAIDALLETYQMLLAENIDQDQIDQKIASMYFSAKRNNERSADWVEKFEHTNIYPEESLLIGDFPDIYNFRRTITPEEINRVLKKYINLENFHLCIFGRESGKKYF